MMDVSLANILLSPTSSMDSRGQSRTELAFLTSLFSLFLSRSVLPQLQQTTAYSSADATTVS